jgi:hypothetical protein
VAVIRAVTNRVRRAAPTVVPSEGTGSLEVHGDALLVPSFSILGGNLLRAAVTAGPRTRL